MSNIASCLTFEYLTCVTQIMSRDNKKSLIDYSFMKGVAVGFIVNSFLNKFALFGAVTGFVAGVSYEQNDPDYWPNIADKFRDAVQNVKDIYNERDDV